MVMYKIKIKGGYGIKLAIIKSLKWVQINSRNKRLKLKKSKFRKEIKLNKQNRIKENKLPKKTNFKECKSPSPKMLKE